MELELHERAERKGVDLGEEESEDENEEGEGIEA